MSKESIKSILTLTTQYANNMGALLQCYALAKYIQVNELANCKVLQYQPCGYNRSWSFFNRPRTLRDLVKNIYCLVNPCILIPKIKKQKIMRKFITDYIPLSSTKYKRKDIENNPPKADAFICGSDQIWNFKYRRDLTYFFDFVNKKDSRIIAYAPSIADPWNDKDAEFIAPYLRRFDSLSVRESPNLLQVQYLSPENHPRVVCDPVFLLKKQQWDDMVDTRMVPNEPYIFCYFLSVTPLAIETVKVLRKLTGLKVVHFNLNALDKFNSEYNIRVAGPNDFVGLISKATYVCTNSFHCSAFSIIYRKNFRFVPKSMANERITSLMDKFSLSDVFVSKDRLEKLTIGDLKVEYSKTEECIEDFITQSQEYLHNALKDE